VAAELQRRWRGAQLGGRVRAVFAVFAVFGRSRGRAGAWCGLTVGEHTRSFWLIRASRPSHQPCPRTPTVCADVMLDKFQRAPTTEVEAWRGQQLGAEILALPPCDCRQAPVLPCCQRLEVFGGMGHSVAIAGCEHYEHGP
jgi:hypothetical protein